jgi:hypothetical protein
MGLTLLSLLGPWVFEVVNVPAQYTCSAPYIRLEGDFCGEPMPGLWILLYYGGGLFSMLGSLFSGTAHPTWLREFMLILLLIIAMVLPIFSLLMTLIKGTPHRRVFNLAVWGMAILFVLFLLIRQLHWALWGLWLFIILAVGVMLIEGLSLLKGRLPAPGDAGP